MAIQQRLHSLKGFLKGSPSAGKTYRLVLEATNACNLRCVMCPRNFMKRTVEHMDRGLFEAIIAQNSDVLEFVGLNGYGEPLLHPNLFDFLKFCRQHKVSTGISTNCTLLDEEKAGEILRNPPDIITLAVDGASAENYEKVRVGAQFDSVIKNVKGFLRMRKKFSRKPFVVLQCIYMSETKKDISKFYKLFSDCAYDAIRVRQLTFTGQQREDENYKNPSVSCYWLWTEPMIFSDGTLVPCCQDVNGEFALGNVNDQPLEELWNQEKVQTLRTKHSTGQRDTIPLCRKCNMYQPNRFLAMGASLFHTMKINTIIPSIESALSRQRYSMEKRKIKE